MQLDSDRRYRVDATPDAVWAQLSATGEYRRWWPWLREFDAAGLTVGDVWQCRVRPPLPYTVAFRIHLDEVDSPRAIGARIDGDIAGTARIELTELDGGCEIRLTSTLSPRSRTVQVMAGLARPVARMGHDWVLDTGARQFAASIGDGGTRGR